MEKVQELLGAGLIQPDVALELLDFPDLESAMGNANAPRNAIRARVASMLDGGEYQSPEPFDDLELIARTVPGIYLEERERGCPEERLESLRRYVTEAQAMLAEAAGPPPDAMPPDGGGMPMEAPPMDPAMMAAA
jgi:hypothetical protein